MSRSRELPTFQERQHQREIELLANKIRQARPRVNATSNGASQRLQQQLLERSHRQKRVRYSEIEKENRRLLTNLCSIASKPPIFAARAGLSSPPKQPLRPAARQTTDQTKASARQSPSSTLPLNKSRQSTKPSVYPVIDKPRPSRLRNDKAICEERIDRLLSLLNNSPQNDFSRSCFASKNEEDEDIHHPEIPTSGWTTPSPLVYNSHHSRFNQYPSFMEALNQPSDDSHLHRMNLTPLLHHSKHGTDEQRTGESTRNAFVGKGQPPSFAACNISDVACNMTDVNSADLEALQATDPPTIQESLTIGSNGAQLFLDGDEERLLLKELIQNLDDAIGAAFSVSNSVSVSIQGNNEEMKSGNEE